MSRKATATRTRSRGSDKSKKSNRSGKTSKLGKPLTDADCRAAKANGNRYQITDGDVPGLVLRVSAGGRKAWSILYYFRARRRRMPLGRYPDTKLKEARRLARDVLGRASRGEDPAAVRQAARIAPKKLGDAVDEYMRAAEDRVRLSTQRTYRTTAERFKTWAAANHVGALDELTRAHLFSFGQALAALPKSTAKRRGKRGQKVSKGAKREAQTVNSELRAAKTMLNAWRVAGRLPNLDRDAISDCLKSLPVDRKRPRFLKPSEIAKLLRACVRHDAATFGETREEHVGMRRVGTTPKYVPIEPFVLFLMLTGARRGEALAVRWEHIDLGASDHDGNVIGEIELPITKTRRHRTVYMDPCPSLRRLLAALRLRSGGTGYLFGGQEPWTGNTVDRARLRLLETYGAPEFDWKALRSTCATYLTNAPAIFGSASVYLSARQLGHSVAVAERHYVGVVRVRREARTLEEAMRIEKLATAAITRATNGRQGGYADAHV